MAGGDGSGGRNAALRVRTFFSVITYWNIGKIEKKAFQGGEGMREYYLDEFRNRENYVKFIAYMLEHSDFFSVVFYRSRKTDPSKRSSREFKDSLRRYHLHSEEKANRVLSPDMLY